LKWPNDVLIEGSKVAGILVESAVEGNEVKYAVLGIGINVNIDQQHLVGVPSAVSLNNATGKEIARDQLLTCLLHEIDALYFDLKQGQTPLAQWKGLLDTLGQQVNVTSGDHSYSGLAEDIDEIGNLQVRMDDGQLVTLTSGDVTLNAPVADVKP
jgi:BirA family biotin operon repressor/biotin-[acetyl-CoA-carboxylase] ligase